MAHKHKYLLIFVVIVIIIVESNAYLDNLNKPCKYLDSIDITNGSSNDDGSITFEGINYPKNLHAWYDYEFLNESYRQPAVPHRRGCTCKLGKPCIRMCCPRGYILNRKLCYSNDSVFDLPATVTINEEIVTTGNIFDNFHYVVGRPCHQITPMEPLMYPDSDTWVLFENGNVRLGIDSIEILNRNNYCFNPTYHDNGFELVLMTCFEGPEGAKDFWIPYGMFISVPFLVLTILVYILLPELRNVHGKSLVCYLLGLTVAYITLGWIKLNGSKYVEAVLCRTLGYVLYSAFMSAFFWLSVISFDLWWNLRGMHGNNKFADLKKFLIYSVYAWGSTTFMVILCYLVDASSIPTKFQPGMGVETCFLKMVTLSPVTGITDNTFIFLPDGRLSEFLYLYLPIIIITTCNSTFFIMTALKIRKVQNEMSRVTAKEDSKKHQKDLNHEKAKFVLFFRLFIIMGVTWTMEAISWLIAPGGWYFYLTDLMNAIQGVVIFCLFVLNRKIKLLIIKRWNIWRGTARKQGTISMCETRTSNITTKSVNKNSTEAALISDEKD